MLRPFDLLENVLIEIEKGIRKGVSPADIAGKFSLSEGHLRRLFRFAFKQSISGYIRSRRLSASLDDLIKTDHKIIDIALSYGYSYEQSYIRAFKDEFGLLPGEFRKTRQIVKVKPPLYLFDENKLKDGVIFGPEIVMVPQFFIAGISHIIPVDDSLTSAPKAAIHFWENDRKHIHNALNPNVYIGLTCNIDSEKMTTEYIASVQVKNVDNVSDNFKGYTFDSCLCARFRYIGKHHYYDINKQMAQSMYKKIRMFENDKKEKFSLLNDKVYFEKIDTGSYDGKYCQMEWFSPVKEKCIEAV